MPPTTPSWILQPEPPLKANRLAIGHCRSGKLPSGSGERVATGPDDHPPAIPTLLDHGRHPQGVARQQHGTTVR